MSRKQKKIKIKYDPAIMYDILNQPGVKEKFDELTPDEQRQFKNLLVTNGTYARHVVARQKKMIREMFASKRILN